MAINAMIPLAGKVADPVNALAKGYELGNTIRQQPMQDKLTQQKLDAGEVDIQNAKLKQQETMHGLAKSSLQGDYYGAQQVAPYLDSGDIQSVKSIVAERKAAKQKLGLPTDTEDNFIADLIADPEKAKNNVKQVISLGQQLFGKSQTQAKPQIYKDDAGTWALMPDGTKQQLGGLTPKESAQPQQAGPGPQSKSVDSWAINTLLTGDPGSKEFAAARAILSRAKTQLVQTENGLVPVTQPPIDLGWAVDGINKPGPIPTPNTDAKQSPAGNAIPGTQPKAGIEQSNAGGFYDRMVNANQIIDRLESEGYRPGIVDFETASGRYISGLTSEQGQLYRQAQENWVRANLRKESGAVIGAEEMDAEIKNYFPVPGDKPATIAQKADNRRVVTEAMRKAAGPAAKPSAAGNQGALPRTNARGWTLHQDANGNRAYVGPNGEIEEVQ